MEKLPFEVLTTIIAYLPFDELANISYVCKSFSSIGTDDIVWKRKCLQDFPSLYAPPPALGAEFIPPPLSKLQLPTTQTSWRDQYINLYVSSPPSSISCF